MNVPPPASNQTVPPDVRAAFVDLLYRAWIPMIVIGIALMGVALAIAWRSADIVVEALIAVTPPVVAARLLLVRAYRRASHAGAAAAAASVWARRYALGSFLFSAMVGLLTVRAFGSPDPIVHMLAVALVCCYGAGVVNRLSVVPWVCVPSLLLSSVPAIGAAALQNDPAYLALAALLAATLVASFETIHFLYRTMLADHVRQGELADLARSDPLTGLANRLALAERLGREVGGPAVPGRHVAVHYIDLDRFKEVNDRFGHPVGDAVLKAAAARIAGTLREHDLLARIGGDEFVVLQTRLDHPDAAAMLARRIVRVVGAPLTVDGHAVEIGASVGVALSPRDGVTLQQLLAGADAALYEAKRRGRARALLTGTAA